MKCTSVEPVRYGNLDEVRAGHRHGCCSWGDRPNLLKLPGRNKNEMYVLAPFALSSRASCPPSRARPEQAAIQRYHVRVTVALGWAYTLYASQVGSPALHSPLWRWTQRFADGLAFQKSRVEIRDKGQRRLVGDFPSVSPAKSPAPRPTRCDAQPASPVRPSPGRTFVTASKTNAGRDFRMLRLDLGADNAGGCERPPPPPATTPNGRPARRRGTCRAPPHAASRMHLVPARSLPHRAWPWSQDVHAARIQERFHFV